MPDNQPSGGTVTIEGRPAPLFDPPLGDTFALNVGGVLNNLPSDDTAFQNQGSDLEDQPFKEPSVRNQEAPVDHASGSAFTPSDPCNPLYQQNAKLRARSDPDCSKKTNNLKNQGDIGEESDTLPQKNNQVVPPRPGTPIKAPQYKEGTRQYEGIDKNCIRYSFGLFPLGVCDSTKPDKTFVSAYFWYNEVVFYRLEDALLGM